MRLAADRSLDATRIVMEKRELHAKIEEVQRELEEEQKATMELTRDMTRQYKGMQEELLNRVCNHPYAATPLIAYPF